MDRVFVGPTATPIPPERAARKPSMSIEWSPLAAIIASHSSFLLTTHVRPDGDALGSEIGMAGILSQMGKRVRIVNVSPTPPRYDFLDPENSIFQRFDAPGARPHELSDAEVVIILDLSSWSQLAEMGAFVRSFSGPRVVIDHHTSQDDLGALVLKDSTAEATGILVQHCARALGASIDATMARGLLTALAMDTGWFRHPSTSASTLRAAAELLEAGVDINSLYRLLFERNTLGRLRMMGTALASLKLDFEGRVAHTRVTREDFIRTGAIPPDTEDLVDYTVSLQGVEVGVLFIEQPRGGVKASWRSRGLVDVAAIAARFGGGGHRAAAGANLPEPLEAQVPIVLKAVREAVLGHVKHDSP
jgi:phosphoesterase RecJ-like protein